MPPSADASKPRQKHFSTFLNFSYRISCEGLSLTIQPACLRAMSSLVCVWRIEISLLSIIDASWIELNTKIRLRLSPWTPCIKPGLFVANLKFILPAYDLWDKKSSLMKNSHSISSLCHSLQSLPRTSLLALPSSFHSLLFSPSRTPRPYEDITDTLQDTL